MLCQVAHRTNVQTQKTEREVSLQTSSLQDEGAFLIDHYCDSRQVRSHAALQSLRSSGLTHVHLLPSYDFGSVPERREDQLEPEVSGQNFQIC